MTFPVPGVLPSGAVHERVQQTARTGTTEPQTGGGQPTAATIHDDLDLPSGSSSVPRMELEHTHAVVVDDAEGNGERLDAAMQASIDEYGDPWPEGDDPFVPGRFRTSLPSRSGPRSRSDERRGRRCPKARPGTVGAGPARRVPSLCRGRRADRRVPPAGRRPARAVRGLPPPRGAHRVRTPSAGRATAASGALRVRWLGRGSRDDTMCWCTVQGVSPWARIPPCRRNHLVEEDSDP